VGKVTAGLGRLITTARTRGPGLGRERLRHLRTNLILLAQAGLAAGLAWLVATKILHTREPVFAPTIALGAVVSSQAQRLRRTAQLVGGVILGVAVGELFILFIGTGYWQVALSVVLAVGLAVSVKGGGTLMYQAGSTAILIAALPPGSHVEFPRLTNAAIGGLVGLTVVILFLPLNPLRAVRRAVSPALASLADRLAGSAHALAAKDAGRAQSELDQIQDMGPQLSRLHDAVEEAREVVSLAPIRWPRRQSFERYERAADHVEHAVRNCQPLIRRTVTLIQDNEPTPERLVAAVGHLGDAARLFHQEFDARQAPKKTQDMALCAVSEAGEAYAEGVGFSGSVVVAQVRTTSTDLLRAAGVGDKDANRMVRRAVGVKTRSRTNLPPE
jgi:uncharacterized membrane protein YgaE (UPF0421/DUF939 family)